MPPLNMVKIENNPELARDINSKAILSTDVNGLLRYKESRRKAITQRNEVLETKKRLETIEQEMANLKRIVGELSVLRSRT